MLGWGKHAVFDLKRCVPQLIRCPYNITDFSKTLVKRIDMKPFGNPWVERFGEGNKMGFTLIQLIETSNITGHFCEETNEAYLDVFSCKDYDPEAVRWVIQDFFMPEHIDTRVLIRGERKY